MSLQPSPPNSLASPLSKLLLKAQLPLHLCPTAQASARTGLAAASSHLLQTRPSATVSGVIRLASSLLRRPTTPLSSKSSSSPHAHTSEPAVVRALRSVKTERLVPMDKLVPVMEPQSLPGSSLSTTWPRITTLRAAASLVTPPSTLRLPPLPLKSTPPFLPALRPHHLCTRH